MFDTIILLTSQVEQMPLGAVLRGHNPQLTVHPALTLEDLAAFEVTMLARARLIAFATPVIVPGRILASLGYGAYNFHPGPPQYPGWAPAHFALYEQANEFGVTVHAMAEHVDSGPIVDVMLFPIPADIGAMALEGIAYAHLARLFWELAEQRQRGRTLAGAPLAVDRKEKLAPRLPGGLRYPARHHQGRARPPHEGVR